MVGCYLLNDTTRASSCLSVDVNSAFLAAPSALIEEEEGEENKELV